MKTTIPAMRDDRTGSTLVVVALLLAAVAMLSLSFLTFLRATHAESQGSRESLSALYACEAGLTRAVDELARGGTGALGTEQAPQAFGGQRFWVEADDIGGGRIALRSYGRDDRARMGVEMIVQPSASAFFRWAAFGEESLHMDSNSRTDSYDSSAGTYASQAVNGSGSNAYANVDGHVGSNASITMNSNSHVYGDASPGPSGTVTQMSNSEVEGSTAPMASTVELPEIVLPFAPGTTSYSGSPATLVSGQYAFNNLTLNSNKTATIKGPATVVCNNFKLKSNAKLYIDSTNGPVEFFVVNDFVLNSNTLVRSLTSSPLDVAFNLMSDNILDPGIDVNFDEDDLTLDSNAQLYGTVYAPSATIEVDSNFELFGAVIARRVDLDSNCRIHYDEQLMTASEADGATYETLCWRLIALP